MADKRVHWADDVAPDEEDDIASFVPPSPRQSPSFSLTNTDDDDSLADSPSPPTPPTTLLSMASSTDIYQARHRARNVWRPIQIPARSFSDAHVKSPDVPSWRFGESPPGSDSFRMMGMGRSLPPPVPPGYSRRDSVSTPTLHPFLACTPSNGTPALVWDVGDIPSSSTVLMITPNDSRTLVPVPASILYAPATNPPQREMRIHCVGHSLWEPLLVHVADAQVVQGTEVRRTDRATPSHRPRQTPPSTAEYVTVMHVIREIYHYLHTRMNSNEYAALGSLPTPGFQREVARSFYERCDAEEHRFRARQALPEWRSNVRSHHPHHRPPSHQMQSPTSPSSERSGASIGAGSARTGGLRRLDCLLRQTRFLGLDNVVSGSNRWYMRVASSSC